MELDTDCFGYFQSTVGLFSVDDAGVMDELCDLWFAVMHVGVVLVYGTTVAVPLHAPLQGGGGETNIVYVAALASVVRAFRMIYYIGLLVVRFPWCGAVPHEKGSCEVGFAESP